MRNAVGTVLLVVVALGLLLKFWYIVLAGLAVAGLVWRVRRDLAAHRQRQAVNAEIAERADVQHAAYMRGETDELGEPLIA